MARKKAALVLGASGSVGQALVKVLATSGWFEPIVTLGRKSVAENIAATREAGCSLREVIVSPMDAGNVERASKDAAMALPEEELVKIPGFSKDANKARDQYRHPKETLGFFGLAPGQTVIEITPGGGWYTAILAPLLHDSGTLVAAVPAAAGPRAQYHARFRDFLATRPDLYGNVRVSTLEPPATIDLGLPAEPAHDVAPDGGATPSADHVHSATAINEHRTTTRENRMTSRTYCPADRFPQPAAAGADPTQLAPKHAIGDEPTTAALPRADPSTARRETCRRARARTAA